MNKNVEKNGVDFPGFEGVVFRDPDTGKAQAKLSGIQFLNAGDAEKIEKLFINSARTQNITLPENFALIAGEIFYDDLQIEELCLGGTISTENGTDSSLMTGIWFTEIKPKMALRDYKIELKRINKNIDYVAAYKFGSKLLLVWNITKQTFSKIQSDTIPNLQPVRIEILKPEYLWRDASRTLEEYERITKAIETFAQNAEAQFNGVNEENNSTDDEFYTICESDNFGTISYKFSQQLVRQKLVGQADESEKITPAKLKKFKKDFKFEEELARSFLIVGRQHALEDVFDNGLPIFKERIKLILADKLSDLLQEAAALTAIERRRVNNDETFQRIKEKVFEYERNQRQVRWGGRPGRRPGTEFPKPADENEKFIREKYEKITNAIENIYLSSLRQKKGKELAYKNVTIDAVCKHIEISYPTLKKWLISICLEHTAMEDFMVYLQDEGKSEKKFAALSVFSYIKQHVLQLLDSKGNNRK